MGRATWRRLAAIAGLMSALTALRAAGDALPPCRPGESSATTQTWHFDTRANPAQPEEAENPHGVPSAAVQVSPVGAGWLNRLFLFGTNQGVWDIGGGGSMTLTIPNETKPAGKLVWVQVYQFRDGGIYNLVAPVSVPGATRLCGEVRPVTTNVIGPGLSVTWIVDQSLWRLEPGPGSHSVVISAPGARISSAIDQVVVDTLNTAPQLAAIPSQSVDEGSLLSFTAIATDAESNTLTFSLGPGAPAGAAIDPAGGQFSWTPSEIEGPATVMVTIRVSDDGTPNLNASTNVLITVNEVNEPPMLSPVPNQLAYPETALRVTNIVSDPDIPVNVLSFSVGPGAPAGLRINATNGILSWRPSRQFAGSTNPVTVIVTDNGAPPFSHSNTFLISVSEYIEVILGRAVLRTGETSSVPVMIETSTGVTNLSFSVSMPSARLTDATVQSLLPEVTATLQADGPERVQLLLHASSGQLLASEQPLANLGFTAPSNQVSAMVPLAISSIQARQSDGALVPRLFSRDGRVVIVGEPPLLESVLSTNGQRMLLLYGEADVTFRVESAPSPNPAAIWTPYWDGGVTNLVQPIAPEANPTIFYRARIAP